MKLVAKVKLLPSEWQDRLLRQTLVTVNKACNWSSRKAWETKTFGKFGLQKIVYGSIREKFGLGAEATIRTIAKVAKSYKNTKKRMCKFKSAGAIDYDSRMLNWRMAASAVSIWCIGGRQKIHFSCGPRQIELLRFQKGEAKLVLINGAFYLFACCDIEEPPPDNVSNFLGVDFGIVNIAADSDGNVYSSGQVNGLRYRHRRLRSKLQSKGTHAAKRLLKKRSGKESRFATQVNHTVSKRIVENAKGTGRGIALEDLSGICDRITARKAQRIAMHNWSFYQLRQHISYKSKLVGVPVVLVDPRNTSRTCPNCGTIDKANRKSQSNFSCVSCGYSGLADTIAAVNISRRATSKLAELPAPDKI